MNKNKRVIDLLVLIYHYVMPKVFTNKYLYDTSQSISHSFRLLFTLTIRCQGYNTKYIID